MSTMIAVFVAIAAAGMLIAYQMGFSAGKREGYDAGKRDGKKEGSAKGFAVGYDRGRHDREVKKEEESAKSGGLFSRIGCGAVCCIGLTASAALVVRIIVTHLDILGDFPNP